MTVNERVTLEMLMTIAGVKELTVTEEITMQNETILQKVAKATWKGLAATLKFFTGLASLFSGGRR